MTHPTTEPTQSIRERLAMTLRQQGWPDNESGEWSLPSAHDLVEAPLDPWLSIIDTLLTELQEPSEGMVAAGWTAVNVRGVEKDFDEVPVAWQAMIQHIRDGGK